MNKIKSLLKLIAFVMNWVVKIDEIFERLKETDIYICLSEIVAYIFNRG